MRAVRRDRLFGDDDGEYRAGLDLGPGGVPGHPHKSDGSGSRKRYMNSAWIKGIVVGGVVATAGGAIAGLSAVSVVVPEDLINVLVDIKPGEELNTFNNNVQTIAGNRSHARIFTVDQQSQLRLSGDPNPNKADPALMIDNLHPNQAGYDQMADRWHEDIVASGVLPDCS